MRDAGIGRSVLSQPALDKKNAGKYGKEKRLHSLAPPGRSSTINYASTSVTPRRSISHSRKHPHTDAGTHTHIHTCGRGLISKRWQLLMKVTSPAAAARVALTTSRPHAPAWEGFHADSQAAHLQMFSHSQHMRADIQQRRHRCLQRGREGRREAQMKS